MEARIISRNLKFFKKES